MENNKRVNFSKSEQEAEIKNQEGRAGEIIEKLIILHIRIWMLEDKSSEVKNDTDLADIKRKIDTCFSSSINLKIYYTCTGECR
jgi:hypothetical protein